MHLKVDEKITMFHKSMATCIFLHTMSYILLLFIDYYSKPSHNMSISVESKLYFLSLSLEENSGISYFNLRDYIMCPYSRLYVTISYLVIRVRPKEVRNVAQRPNIYS